MKLASLIFMVFLATSACLSRTEAPASPKVLAYLNDTPIREDEVRVRLKLMEFAYNLTEEKDAAVISGLIKQTLNSLILNRSIIAWGMAKGITLPNEEKAAGLGSLKKGYTEKEFETMLEERDISPTLWAEIQEENLYAQKIMQETLKADLAVTEKEISDFYEKNLAQFKTGERVKIRQIITDTKEKADLLRARLAKGENFAKLAIMHSLSPDRAQGGELGYFERGTYPKEFDETCFNLSPGEVSKVVKSPYGYHIFKLLDRKPAGTKDLQEALPLIQSTLMQKKMAIKKEAWLNEIKSAARVVIMDQAVEEMEL